MSDLFLYVNFQFLISFASSRIFAVISEVSTDLVQSNPSLYQKDVCYVMRVDLVLCSVPVFFAKESDLRTPKCGTL